MITEYIVKKILILLSLVGIVLVAGCGSLLSKAQLAPPFPDLARKAVLDEFQSIYNADTQSQYRNVALQPVGSGQLTDALKGKGIQQVECVLFKGESRPQGAADAGWKSVKIPAFAERAGNMWFLVPLQSNDDWTILACPTPLQTLLQS